MFGGTILPRTADELTGEDFTAVSMLSVNVGAEAAVGLPEKAGEVRQLLAAIPIGVECTDLNRVGFERHLGPNSAAQELWDVLRSDKEPWVSGDDNEQDHGRQAPATHSGL